MPLKRDAFRSWKLLNQPAVELQAGWRWGAQHLWPSYMVDSCHSQSTTYPQVFTHKGTLDYIAPRVFSATDALCSINSGGRLGNVASARNIHQNLGRAGVKKLHCGFRSLLRLHVFGQKLTQGIGLGDPVPGSGFWDGRRNLILTLP